MELRKGTIIVIINYSSGIHFLVFGPNHFFSLWRCCLCVCVCVGLPARSFQTEKRTSETTTRTCSTWTIRSVLYYCVQSRHRSFELYLASRLCCRFSATFIVYFCPHLDGINAFNLFCFFPLAGWRGLLHRCPVLWQCQ